MEEEKRIKVGTWGGNGGTIWDDGTFSGVREIRLEFNTCIGSILVVYDQQGRSFNAQKHGGLNGKKTASIKLEYPDEFLTGISGHSGTLDKHFIRSLTFKSNKRTFGPYGVEYGQRFTFSSHPDQEIVGFYGKSGGCLDSIGLHLSSAKPRAFLQKLIEAVRKKRFGAYTISSGIFFAATANLERY